MAETTFKEGIELLHRERMEKERALHESIEFKALSFYNVFRCWCRGQEVDFSIATLRRYVKEEKIEFEEPIRQKVLETYFDVKYEHYLDEKTMTWKVRPPERSAIDERSDKHI